MAHLFSHKLLHDTVKSLIIPQMDEKIAVLQSWVNAISNKSIYKKTESECEQAFNLDIFHKVLGYSFYPTENYTLEAKGGNEVSGQKADATLGHFNTSEIDKNVSLVQVAVEIKDANTALTKSQRREGNLSPIQQGFKYKPQYNNCKRVLVTNFIEVRLFKDTQLDYEAWNLVDLINPENEYHNFKMFWYLLNAKHLIAPVGMESVTERLLSVVRIQSEQITKKFYQEYKTLRLELINDIRSNNPAVSLDVVIQKSQKVIDRIVFVHFCEDFGLLPDGKLAEVIQYSQSLVGVSVRQILSGFFEAVNSGSSKLGIPNGYNGGLFHEDKELNNLKIGDAICQKFVDLGKYDFQEELSVNILGHIFEQSISDLEDLRINMLGIELETGELGESSKSNKRKKDGIFYTPEYIVDYIVRNSLGKYLEEQFETIERKHLKKEKQMSDKVYQEKQQSIYGEYKQVLENITVLDPACGSGAFLVKVFDYLLAEHKRVGEVLNSIFDNESTYKSILQRNIYGVDLNAESVEITKLSLWLKTAEKGKKLADLDGNIKCGNSLIDDPAVAGDKAFDWKTEFAEIMNAGGFDVVVGNPPYGAEISKKEQIYLTKKYIQGGGETAISFMKLGYDLLKNKGAISFIIPKSFVYASNYSSIRAYYEKGLFTLVDCKKVWKEVLLEQIIFSVQKGEKYNLYKSFELIDKQFIFVTDIDKKLIGTFGFLLNGLSKHEISIGIKIASIGHTLNDCSKNQRGAMLQKYISLKGERKVIGGGDIQRHGIVGNKGFIDSSIEIPSQANTKENSILVQNIIAHIENPKPHIKITALFTSNKDYLILDTINQLVFTKNLSNKIFRAILNSNLINRYCYRFIVGKAIRTMHFDNYITSRIPIPVSINQQPLIEKADQMLDLNKQFQEKIDFTLRFLQSKFSIEKPSTKLSKFRELDFSGFLKELKVKKLPLDTEAELMRYFEKEKAEIVTLKAQIDTLDKQIDDMVFDMYGMTEEERKVVLDS